MAKKWRGDAGCKCTQTFGSWVYVSDIPREKGPVYHLWKCVICLRNHVTMDKRKPSEAQQGRTLR